MALSKRIAWAWLYTAGATSVCLLAYLYYQIWVKDPVFIYWIAGIWAVIFVTWKAVKRVIRNP
jgi:hypothetical protein